MVDGGGERLAQAVNWPRSWFLLPENPASVREAADAPRAGRREAVDVAQMQHRGWLVRCRRSLMRALVAGLFLALAVTAASPAPSALAAWRAGTATTTSIAYNNGIAFDPARSNLFFAGVTSGTNSGLYRTNAGLRVSASNAAVIPDTKEGYNHIGDLSFDAVGRRLLLPLECYYPTSGGNICGVGAIGVADPVTLRLRYYVSLDSEQIKKVMWAEISPDGHWIWTSSGTTLLAYPASKINAEIAATQRAGKMGGVHGRSLGAVLPTGSVTGATFYQGAPRARPRLLLALNRKTDSAVVSFVTGAAGRPPSLASRIPRTEITVARSARANEPEGLAVTSAGSAVRPMSGVLHWLMLPVISSSSLYSRILNYSPSPARSGGLG